MRHSHDVGLWILGWAPSPVRPREHIIRDGLRALALCALACLIVIAVTGGAWWWLTR